MMQNVSVFGLLMQNTAAETGVSVENTSIQVCDVIVKNEWYRHNKLFLYFEYCFVHGKYLLLT